MSFVIRNAALYHGSGGEALPRTGVLVAKVDNTGEVMTEFTT